MDEVLTGLRLFDARLKVRLGHYYKKAHITVQVDGSVALTVIGNGNVSGVQNFTNVDELMAYIANPANDNDWRP